MNGDKDSLWRTAERLGLLFGLLALAFAAGANWHRVDVLDEKVSAQGRDFARKDVLTEQLINIERRIEDANARLVIVQDLLAKHIADMESLRRKTP